MLDTDGRTTKEPLDSGLSVIDTLKTPPVGVLGVATCLPKQGAVRTASLKLQSKELSGERVLGLVTRRTVGPPTGDLALSATLDDARTGDASRIDILERGEGTTCPRKSGENGPRGVRAGELAGGRLA